jgi:predicted transposase/invertase (TIGR01784 family)
MKGKTEGRIEGRIEGIIEGKLEVAKRLILRGMSLEEAAEVVGIDAELLNN